MKKNNKYILIFLVIAIVFSQSLLVNAQSTIDESSDYIKNVIEMVLEKYNGNITEEEIINGALSGIFSTMDKYSQFIEKSNDDYITNLTGSYVGIGVSFIKVVEGVQLVDVFKNSPASFAGLKVNDIIVSVNNVSIKDMDNQSIASIIKGEEGTTVLLGIIREDSPLQQYEVVRAKIDFNPVSYRITQDIAYIKIESFQQNAVSYFKEAMSEINNKGISKLIIDLRGNGGGDVNTCVSIAREVVPEGLITKIDFKSKDMIDNTFNSYRTEPNFKIAVLVDGGTASASEIFASAIQDSGTGALIGSKTYGKGIVQTVFPMLTPEAFEKYKAEENIEAVNSYDLFMQTYISPKDSEIIGWGQMTTGYYLTRNGRRIHGIGLEPEISASTHELVNGIEIDSIDYLTSQQNLTINNQNSDILNVEKMLKILGYDIDEPDMKYDEKSFNAIKEFQKTNSLFTDGVIGESTKEVLNNEIENQRINIDEHYGKAVKFLNMFK